MSFCPVTGVMEISRSNKKGKVVDIAINPDAFAHLSRIYNSEINSDDEFVAAVAKRDGLIDHDYEDGFTFVLKKEDNILIYTRRFYVNFWEAEGYKVLYVDISIELVDGTTKPMTITLKTNKGKCLYSPDVVAPRFTLSFPSNPSHKINSEDWGGSWAKGSGQYYYYGHRAQFLSDGRDTEFSMQIKNLQKIS